MQKIWEVDANTLVQVTYGSFRKKVVSVNGKALTTRFKLKKNFKMTVQLSEQRRGELSVTPRMIGGPIIALRVDGRLMAETTKQRLACAACRALVQPNDRFCDGCGAEQRSAEDRFHGSEIGAATKTINGLAILFVLSGIAMYFVTKYQLADTLAKLDGMPSAMELPRPIDGVTYTVATLRAKLAWQPWGVLIVSGILAAVMALLAQWGKRAPLAALLVATATYAVVLVANAIVDPSSIAQGLFLKIIIIAYLFRGIKSALALRAPDA